MVGAMQPHYPTGALHAATPCCLPVAQPVAQLSPPSDLVIWWSDGEDLCHA